MAQGRKLRKAATGNNRLEAKSPLSKDKKKSQIKSTTEPKGPPHIRQSRNQKSNMEKSSQKLERVKIPD
jgi:hypothetical protein